jgi:hypothetical protein
MHAISISLRRWSAIKRVVLLPGLWIVVCSTLGTQTITYACPPATPTSATADPTFEVASVRPNHSGDVSSCEHTGRGRLTVTNDTLKQLILVAFDVKDFQIEGGPDGSILIATILSRQQAARNKSPINSCVRCCRRYWQIVFN